MYRLQAGGAWQEEARLLRPNPQIHDNVGRDVAVQGDLMVADAPDFPYSASMGTGAAYVDRRVGGVWTEEAELHGSNAGVDSNFGQAVALDGTTILPAFIANGLGDYDLFGRAVALDGVTAVLGSADNLPGFSGLGAAHVFDVAPRFVLVLDPEPPIAGENLNIAVR